ncbi:MAG: hypothetical protein D8M59_01090 [Planctomycetes bacterium]|nr:hypothetical protein [Planctomycetota bacterium]NOG54683.1 hypothetical protein [Planctomycetota bacterium]
MSFISLQPAAKMKLGTAAAVIGPVVLVLFTKLLGMGPGHVQGGEQGDGNATAGEAALTGVAHNVTQELRCDATHEAGTAAQALRHEAFPQDPFYLTGMFGGDPSEMPVPTPDLGAGNQRFSISGFISGSRPMAVINDQVCTIGQTVTAERFQWTVEAIDCEKRTVTLRGSDGKSFVVEADEQGTRSPGRRTPAQNDNGPPTMPIP